MRKLIISLHTTLDGFVAGPNGEMDWIKLDAALFDLVGTLTEAADTALYGRVTYQMMDSYWPTAADYPNPTKHDVEHSSWYNNARKVVLSGTLSDAEAKNATIIRNNIATEIQKLKDEAGKNILMFGSPTAAHALMEHNLIDEYWLFVNPIILGKGIPVFANVTARTELQLLKTEVFAGGVVALQYAVVR